MSTKYPGGFISSTEPTVSPLSAKGIWTLAEALRYKTAGEWPVSPIYVGVQGVFATANVGQAESVIPVLLTGLQATGSVNDLTVIGSAIVALDTVSGTGGVGEVSISLPVVFDEYFNLNSMLLADSLANTFITDEGPNKFVITPNGDTRPSAFSPYNTNWSNYFDGTGDYLSIPSDTAFDIGSSSFTIEAWIYPLAFKSPGGFPIISRYEAVAGSSGWLLRVVDSSTIRFARGNDVTLDATGLTIPLNTWSHIAVSRVSGNLSIFFNGNRVQTVSGIANFGDATGITVQIGRTHTLTDDAQGSISNVRLVKGSAVYDPTQTTITVPTAPLTAVSGTSLLTCQSNRLIDNSTNNFTLTKNGDVKVTAFAPFTETDTSTGSGYFDGTGDWLTIPNSTEINFSSATTFTVEFWIYPTAYAAGTGFNEARTILSTALTFPNGWRIDLTTTSLVWYTYTNSNAITTVVSLSTWTHFAVTHDGTTTRLYKNGVLAGSANTTWPASSSLFYIGALNSGSYVYPYLGYISNLRIVKGTAVYTSNFSPPTAPVTAIANTSLLTLQHRVSYNNSQPIDESGIKNIVTRNGNASVGAYSPFVPSGWSGYFDGTGDSLSNISTALITQAVSTFTVQGWIYMTANPTTDANNISGFIALDGQPAATTNYLSFGPISSRVLYLRWFDGAPKTAIGSTTLNLNQWYHIACVVNSNAIQFYVNGVAESMSGTTTLTNRNGTSGNFSIGQNYYGAVSGYISNISVTTTAVVFSGTPPTAPLEPISGTRLLTLRGPSFTDDGPNRFAITRNGDTKIIAFSPFAPNTVTPDSYSVYFDGTGDYLTVPDNVAFTMGAGDFTLEAWVYVTTTSGSQMIFGTSDSGGSQGSMSFVLQARNSSGFPAVGVGYAGTLYFATSSEALVANTWTHIAGVRNGATVTIYVNGVSRGTLNMAALAITDSSQVVGIGRNGAFNGEYLTGYISNARIVKGTAVYTANFTPPTAPLTAISGTSLLTCQSPTVIDNSTNDFAITVNGNSQPTKFNPFGETVATNVEYTPAAHGGSVYFDLSGDNVGISSSADLALGSGNFTLEAWVYPTSFPNQFNFIFDQRPTGTNGAYPTLYATSSATVWFVNSSAQITGSVLPLLQWSHVAISRSSGSTKMFINGSQSGSTFTDSINYTYFSTEYKAFIGASGFGGGADGYFNGYISNFRIVKGTAVYTSAFVPPQAPTDPIAATTLLTCGNNAAIYDYTGKNVLETVGNARTVQETPYRDNHSVYFDGNDSLGASGNSALALGNGDFTIECWIYILSLSASRVIASSRLVNGGSTLYWLFNVSTDGQLNFQSRTSGGTQYYARSATGAIETNTWYHVAATRTSGKLEVYIDGVVQTTQADNDGNNNITESSVGIGIFNYTGFETYMNGYVSNFRIVKGTAIVPPSGGPTSPLTAVSGTSLLTCNTYNFTDSSTNNFTITRNGDARISSRGPFVQNEGDRCMYFDGTGDWVTGTGSYTLGNTYTIEMWLYTNTVAAGNAGLINLATSSTTNPGINIYRSSAEILCNNGTTAGTGPSSGAGTITVNAWTHLAIVADGTNTKLYLDGVLKNTYVGTTGSTSELNFVTIGSFNDKTAPFNGYIDDLRITRGYARYTSNFTPPSEPLPKV